MQLYTQICTKKQRKGLNGIGFVYFPAYFKSMIYTFQGQYKTFQVNFVSQ